MFSEKLRFDDWVKVTSDESMENLKFDEKADEISAYT